MSSTNYPKTEDRQTELESQDRKDYPHGRNSQNNPPPQTGSNRVAYIVVVEEVDGDDLNAEDDNPALMKFQDKSRRMLFVRKVLGSVGLQFLVCTLFIAICKFEPHTAAFFKTGAGSPIAFVCMLLWFCLFIAISCCGVGYGKPNPTNISLMIISTGLLSVYTGALVVSYDIPSIMITAATTVGVVLILSVITFSTKIDISGKGMYILGAVLALFLFSIITSILFVTGVIEYSAENRLIISMTISALAAMLFAVMILYQLKLIVGGGQYQYGEDDWLLASITLFYDILMFFLQMLQLTRLMR